MFGFGGSDEENIQKTSTRINLRTGDIGLTGDAALQLTRELARTAERAEKQRVKQFGKLLSASRAVTPAAVAQAGNPLNSPAVIAAVVLFFLLAARR